MSSTPDKASPDIVMYRTRGCPYCVMAAELFEELGADVREVFLDNEPDRQAITSAILPGHRTVPLVVIDDKPIGGFDDLRALHASGKLGEQIQGS